MVGTEGWFKKGWRKPELKPGPKPDLSLWAWTLVGLGLRLLRLDSKPAWSDEWATLIFSLGHSFRSVPLDQLISLETLLAPARLDGAGGAQVVQSLMGESTHPPLYFLLSHFWIHCWQPLGALVDLGVARSLSAVFGILTIPAAYVLAQVITRSRSIARTAAALMAVSPFGIYLAQDARHYTLAMLFSMVSIGCFVQAWRSLAPQAGHERSESAKPLSLTIVALWVTANLLGLATHYFVGLLLLAQVTALAGLVVWNIVKGGQSRTFFLGGVTGQPIAIAIGLTLLGALPWSIFLMRIPDDSLTAWIQRDPSILGILGPPLRLLVALASMIVAPAVENVPIGMAIVSAVPLLLAAIWLLPKLWRGRWRGWKQGWPRSRGSGVDFGSWALLALLLAELLWILGITYGFGRDLTLGARYLFGLLPVVGLMAAIAIQQSSYSRRIKQVLIVLGFVGSLFVTADMAYSKPDQSAVLVQEIRSIYYQEREQPEREQPEREQPEREQPEHEQPDAELQRLGQAMGPITSASEGSIVIGGVYKTHEQVSELMSLAYEWLHLEQHLPRNKSNEPWETVPQPSFVLAQRRTPKRLATHAFQAGFESLPRPLDLWLVNFAANLDFTAIGCDLNPTHKISVTGYRAKRYVCPKQEAP